MWKLRKSNLWSFFWSKHIYIINIQYIWHIYKYPSFWDIRSHHPKILLHDRAFQNSISESGTQKIQWSHLTLVPISFCSVSFEICSFDMYVGECSGKKRLLETWTEKMRWTTLLHCQWSQGQDCILLKVAIEGHDIIPQKCGTSLAGSTSQYIFYGISMLESLFY